MLYDAHGQLVTTPPRPTPDPIDGYVPGPDPAHAQALAGAMAREVERVEAARADVAAGRQVSRRDAADAAGVNLDGFVNQVTSVGDYLRDKTLGGQPGGPGFQLVRVSSWQAEALARGSDIGRRIISVIPDEMTREGWDCQIQPTDEDRALERDPGAKADACHRSPARAAAGWRAMAKRAADGGTRRAALAYAERWDDIAFGAPAEPPPPPPPGPLPRMNDEGIALAEAMEDKAAELDLVGAVNRVLKYERTFGGGALFIGADDGTDDLTAPLDESRIRSIRHVTPYHGGYDGEIIAWRYYTDPLSPRYGEPEVYMVRNLGVPVARTPAPGERNPPPVYGPQLPTGPMVWYVHESRLITFGGDPVTRRAAVENRGWDDSVFTRCLERLSQFQQSWQGLSILLQELSIAVLKVKDLPTALTGPRGADMIARAQQIAITKSIARLTLLDSEEDFSRVTATLTGASDLMSQMLLLVAAAADMPVSLLVGQVKGGLGDAGATDIRFFYDRIKAWISRRMLPRLTRLYRLLWLAKDSPTRGVEPGRWRLTAPELWQPTPTETAALRLTYAQIDTANIASGIYTPEEAAASRYGGSEFGTEITLDLEARGVMGAALREPPPERTPQPPAPVLPGSPVRTRDPLQQTIPPMHPIGVSPISGDPQAVPTSAPGAPTPER